MEIKKDYDLTGLNTFGVQAKAKFFAEAHTESELLEIFKTPEFKENKKLFLGGGSNILFTRDFDGIVVQSRIKGIDIIAPTEAGVPIEVGKDDVLIRAMGGEVWHDLVVFAVGKNYWGLENLSSIPGTVGAAPMQNIGAYGAELKEVLKEVEAYDVETGEKKIFPNDTYTRGYRESIFKNDFKGKYFITALVLKLSKVPKPNLNYKGLAGYLEKNNLNKEAVEEISRAVTEIRKEKLPDPKIIANAGSFFKNVIVNKEKFEELKKTYPDMPSFPEENGIKIPSGWLIEQCGYKGKRVGNVGVYEKHALVLVNHGGATGQDIKNLAEQIIVSIHQKFGLTLVPEVNFI